MIFRNRRKILILSLVFLIVGVSFVVFAFYNPQMSFPMWIPSSVIKGFYALYSIISLSLFIMSVILYIKK